MNIIYKNQTCTYFEELKIGDVFQTIDFEEVYMKIAESKHRNFTFNAINLQDGNCSYFATMTGVKKLDVELIVK